MDSEATGLPLRAGDAVTVCDEDGRPLFRGRLADTSPPWAGWSRVIPDGPVDLPSRYKIIRSGGGENRGRGKNG